MGASIITNPLPLFTGLNGLPLDAGYINIGQPSLNPLIPANQIVLWWDAAHTIPAAQPIRTIAGYPNRNGAPSRFYADDEIIAIVVRDKNKNIVTYDPRMTATDAGLRADLASTSSPGGASLVGYYDPVAPTYLKTISDVINGEDVSIMRFIEPAKYASIQAGTNSDDLAPNFLEASQSGVKSLFIPRGTFNLGSVAFAASLRRLRGLGEASRLVALGPTFSGNTWLQFNFQSDVDIGDFSASLDSVAYSGVVGMQFAGITRGKISDIHFTDGGRFPLYVNDSGALLFKDIIIDTYAASMAIVENTSEQIVFDGLRSAHAGTGSAISINGGSYHVVRNCFAGGAGLVFFTVGLLNTSHSKVHNNTVLGSRLEAIQITDGSFNEIFDNDIICGSDHRDFGISIFADNVDIKYNSVYGNVIIGSGGPGIGISASPAPSAQVCSLNIIEDNTIINPCQFTTIVPAAIDLLGGATCTGNTVQNNTCLDESGNMVYCVEEWTNGGNPNNNKLIHNPGFGPALISEANPATPNLSEVYDLKAVSFAAVVTSASGTITTASGAAYYKRRGTFVDISLIISITTNGTGAGAVNISLPFNPIGGALAGTAAVSGKALTGVYGTNKVTIRNYDGTYPGASGETLNLTGTLLI